MLLVMLPLLCPASRRITSSFLNLSSFCELTAAVLQRLKMHRYAVGGVSLGTWSWSLPLFEVLDFVLEYVALVSVMVSKVVLCDQQMTTISKDENSLSDLVGPFAVNLFLEKRNFFGGARKMGVS